MSKMQKYILIGEKYVSSLSPTLNSLGFHVISVPGNPNIDPRLSSHVDLSIFCADNIIFAAKHLEDSKLNQFICKAEVKISFIEENQGEKYPHDAQLNVCLMGNTFIYNPQTASSSIVTYLKKQGREGIECKQGYTRCSVCVVDECSIITSDHGIAVKCRAAGIDVLETEQGYIDLQGFGYGFIGGASIKLSDKLLAFSGTLSKHPQHVQIEEFIKSKGVEIIYLSDLPAFDIGSAIII